MKKPPKAPTSTKHNSDFLFNRQNTDDKSDNNGISVLNSKLMNRPVPLR